MDLNKVKKYLSIFDDFDDELLQDYIVSSQIYIDSCVGEGYKSNPHGIKISEILMLRLIHDMYENRGADISSNQRRDIITTSMLNILDGMGSNYEV